MRVAELLRGSCDSFRRAAKRSSAGLLRSAAIAFSFLRLDAYWATILRRVLFLLTELCFAMQSSKGRSGPHPQVRNGKLKPRSSARASSSFLAVVQTIT